jgi:cell division protein FtsB
MGKLHAVKQGFDIKYVPAFLVCGLCFYFTYHLMQGQRSVWSYFSNQTVIEQKQADLKTLDKENKALEANVTKLRVATIDIDYLKERARHMLGYTDPDEIILITK